MSESEDQWEDLMQVGIDPSLGNPLWEEAAPEIPGYEIEGELGAGGMGVVYLARNTRLGRQVAVKMMHLGPDSLENERLLREGKALGKLNHRHIVGVHDFVVDAGGRPCLIMEFVSGGTMRERLDTGLFSPTEALGCLRQIVEGLQSAHLAGIWHRDLKPANILFAEDGTVKVGDFGLAAFQQDAESHSLTLSGTTLGTLDYMSPEQKAGDTHVDQRSDIYSLGVMFYEMISGRRPSGVFAPLANKECDRVVRKCLQEHPEDRYQNCGGLLKDLDGIRPRKRRPVLSGILIVWMAVAGILAWQRMGGSDDVETKAPLSLPTPGETVVVPVSSVPTDRPMPQPSPAVSVAPVEIDLLAMATERLDSLRSRGTWIPDNGRLLTRTQPGTSIAWLSFPVPLPERYELLVEIERVAGSDSVPVFFTTAVGSASFEIDAWEQGLGGFQNVNGQDLRSNGTGFTAEHNPDGVDRIRLQVSPQSVRVQLNQDPWRSLSLQNRRLSVNPIWETPGDMEVGLGAWEGDVRFHRFEIKEISP